jgi:hypothetical protein
MPNALTASTSIHLTLTPRHALRLHKDFMQAPAANKIPGLLEAIQYYQLILNIFTEWDFPVDWAMTQTNLGIAYQNFPTGDRGQHLTRAIACYEAALRVYTERDFPVDWATTQTNLGNAYQNFSTGDRGQHLTRAIACYEAALRVRTAETLPFDCLPTVPLAWLPHAVGPHFFACVRPTWPLLWRYACLRTTSNPASSSCCCSPVARCLRV